MNFPPKLAINRDARPHVERIGEDRNVVIVIDDFLSNAEEIRQFALRSKWQRTITNEGYYPGYLAHPEIHGLEALAARVGDIVWREYAMEEPFKANHVLARSFFAIFAPDPKKFYSALHVDNHSWLAALLHLTPGIRGSGTAFWRHRPTGVQSIWEGGHLKDILRTEMMFGVDIFNRAREAFVASDGTWDDWVQSLVGLFKMPWPTKDFGAWEMIHYVPAQFNRLVVYPTWQYHSVATKRYAPPRTMEEARLTMNVFIRHRAFGPWKRIDAAPLPRFASRRKASP